MADDDFTVDAAEFKRFYKAVSNIDVEIKKQLRKKMVEAAKPIVEEVKTEALAIPAKGGNAEAIGRKVRGQTMGLRQALAASAKADFNGTGRGGVVHVRISTTKFMANSGRPRTIPYYMEGRRYKKYGRWRHPVFGRRANPQDWPTQPSHPFLGVTVLRNRDSFEKTVTSVVLDIVSEIDPTK